MARLPGQSSHLSLAYQEHEFRKRSGGICRGGTDSYACGESLQAEVLATVPVWQHTTRVRPCTTRHFLSKLFDSHRGAPVDVAASRCTTNPGFLDRHYRLASAYLHMHFATWTAKDSCLWLGHFEQVMKQNCAYQGNHYHFSYGSTSCGYF